MRERLDWVDALKGAAIMGVVFFHTTFVLDDVVWPYKILNNELGLFGLPAFFLASGLVTSFGLQRDWPTYLRRRVMPLVVAFLLWTTVIMLSSYLLFWPEPVPLDQVPMLFVKPLFALWFIPALVLFAFLARLCAPAPLLTVVIASGYAVVFWSSDTGFRIADALRYFAFFAAGAYYQPLICRLLEPRPLPLMIVSGPVYIVLCLVPGSHYNAVTALIGVVFFASAMVYAVRTPLFRPLSYVGSQSIAIYLMHMLVIKNFGVLPAFQMPGVSVWGPVVLTVLGTVVPIWLRPQLPQWLFVAPREAPDLRRWANLVRPPRQG